MVVTLTTSLAEAPRIAQQGQAPHETIGHRGSAELLLGVVLDATCGVASPVMLTVHIGEPLRDGPFELDARLAHAQGGQQRWLAELRQAGMLVGRAHVLVEADLPSSSYVPWRGAIRPARHGHGDGMAQSVRVARLFDTAVWSRAGASALLPLWFTIRYAGDAGEAGDAGQPARPREPLTVSAIGEQRIGTLRQYEVKVCQGSEMIATLTAIYQPNHG